MFLSKMLRYADHPYLFGKGGRMANNGKGSLQGMSIASLKHHVALQPLFLIMGGGIAFVAAYCFRLCYYGTDVNFTKASDRHIKYYENKQFKFMNPCAIDYSTISDKRNAPKLD